MAKRTTQNRLSDRDPWTVMDEARAQRGRIVATWLMAALTFVGSPRSWGRAARGQPDRRFALNRPHTG